MMPNCFIVISLKIYSLKNSDLHIFFTTNNSCSRLLCFSTFYWFPTFLWRVFFLICWTDVFCIDVKVIVCEHQSTFLLFFLEAEVNALVIGILKFISVKIRCKSNEIDLNYQVSDNNSWCWLLLLLQRNHVLFLFLQTFSSLMNFLK